MPVSRQSLRGASSPNPTSSRARQRLGNGAQKRQGEIPLPQGAITEQLQAQGAVLLPILPRHIEAVRSLSCAHQDPFDRLLIAQAQDEKLTLLTRDAQIHGTGVGRSGEGVMKTGVVAPIRGEPRRAWFHLCRRVAMARGRAPAAPCSRNGPSTSAARHGVQAPAGQPPLPKGCTCLGRRGARGQELPDGRVLPLRARWYAAPVSALPPFHAREIHRELDELKGVEDLLAVLAEDPPALPADPASTSSMSRTSPMR